jgi:Response regulator containing a CheY-like receiver domain and an HTH DNA-binding domain
MQLHFQGHFALALDPIERTVDKRLESLDPIGDGLYLHPVPFAPVDGQFALLRVGAGCAIPTQSARISQQKQKSLHSYPQTLRKSRILGRDRKMSEISLILAVNSALFRESICKILDSEKDIKIIGQASNHLEIITLIEQKKPDVLFMDTDMLNVAKILQSIREKSAKTRVLYYFTIGTKRQ